MGPLLFLNSEFDKTLHKRYLLCRKMLINFSILRIFLWQKTYKTLHETILATYQYGNNYLDRVCYDLNVAFTAELLRTPRGFFYIPLLFSEAQQKVKRENYSASSASRAQPRGAGCELGRWKYVDDKIEWAISPAKRRRILDAADILPIVGGRSKDCHRFRDKERLLLYKALRQCHVINRAWRRLVELADL